MFVPSVNKNSSSLHQTSKPVSSEQKQSGVNKESSLATERKVTPLFNTSHQEGGLSLSHSLTHTHTHFLVKILLAGQREQCPPCCIISFWRLICVWRMKKTGTDIIFFFCWFVSARGRAPVLRLPFTGVTGEMSQTALCTIMNKWAQHTLKNAEH